MALGTPGPSLTPEEAQEIAQSAGPTLRRTYNNMPGGFEGLLGKPMEVDGAPHNAEDLKPLFDSELILDLTGMCPFSHPERLRESPVPHILRRTKADVEKKVFVRNEAGFAPRGIETVTEDPLVYLAKTG